MNPILPLFAAIAALFVSCSTTDDEPEQHYTPSSSSIAESSSSAEPSSSSAQSSSSVGNTYYSHCIDDEYEFCYPTTGGNKCIWEGEDWTGIDRFGNGCPYDLDLPTPYVPSSSSASTPSYKYCVNSSYQVCYLTASGNVCASTSDQLSNTCSSSYYELSTSNPRNCYSAIDYYKNEESKANLQKNKNLSQAQAEANRLSAQASYNPALAAQLSSQAMSVAYDANRKIDSDLFNLKVQLIGQNCQ